MFRKDASRKKAFTLIEISIVLALVSLIAVITISMCVLFDRRTDSSAKKLAFTQDVTIAKSVINSLADEFDDLDTLLSFNENTLTNSSNNQTYTFSTFNSFEISKKVNGQDVLYICQVVSYDNLTLIFTVNSFIGESL